MRIFAVLVSVLLLASCATPYVQSPLVSPDRYTTPVMDETRFVMRDGAVLPYLRWMPE